MLKQSLCFLFAAATLGLPALFPLPLAAASRQAAAKTVWDGAYTAEQAVRGQAAYSARCASCHGEDFMGVAGTNASVLLGKEFLEHWREDDLSEFFHFLQTSMPSRNAASMTDEAKLDVIAYLLKANGFPGGTAELTARTTEQIALVGKEGPKPLPSTTSVRAVGCLTLATGNVWTLTGVPEPSRSRSVEETTAEELKTSATQAAGSLAFKLPGLDFAIPGVKPADMKGHKVQVKGTVYRQANNDRINVRSLASLAPTCP